MVYSQASVTNRSGPPTRMLPPMSFKMPPTEMVGSVSAARQDVCDHGSRCGLSMGSGNRNGLFVVAHQFA